MKAPFVVLVAEDDPVIRNLIRFVLVRAGYSILLAADGEEALQLSRQFSGEIHLLLSDVVMPKMNGLALVQRVCQERPAIRALVMSGKMSSEIIEGNVPFNFLRKPFLPIQLTQRIEAILADTNSGSQIESID